MEPNAIRVVSSEANCRKDDIEVIQVPTEKLPSGCQVFSVQILNECSGGSECNIGSIHLSCGSFHSELMINPRMFRLLGNNDCLVNDGKPIASGKAVSFSYASTTQFPLSVSSMAC
ncbi:hypothetical protein M0R45_014497 [Rubus argutus]|uniref:Uncharacterized protein n=1 Tax=Rubus argutus TaxID=59490 RepID=A0AAW1XP92_RUBAR